VSRIVVIGMSGAGKTTLARKLAAQLGTTHIELDSLHWDRDWTPRPLDRFRALAAEAVAAERWVADGNYSSVRDVVWPRATTIIWLNLPFRVVFGRVLARSLRRAFTGETLWQGNRESLTRTFFSRESILWWVITQYGAKRRGFKTLRRENTYPHLEWIELRSPFQVHHLRLEEELP
jgi:adenylate kinase family enzyme